MILLNFIGLQLTIGILLLLKKPNQYDDSSSQIDFTPDIVHILNWVNFSPRF